MGFAVLGAILALLLMWISSVRRRLTGMEENISNAMGQIGVQLSARLDALIALLDLAKGYAANETELWNETLKSRRTIITATSLPEDVRKQERMISEALDCIGIVAEQNPELKRNENFTKCMNAVDSYEKMVCTSSLIYNDSVSKLNRELRLFPTFLCAGILGFHKRDYLETAEATGYIRYKSKKREIFK